MILFQARGIVRAGLALDKRAPPTPRSQFIKAQRAENAYARQLRDLARQIGRMVNGIYDPLDANASADTVTEVMDRYAKTLTPWARAVGSRMVLDVGQRDLKAWKTISTEMGRIYQAQIATAPTGLLMQQRVADQVDLITSLPTEAAERVQHLTIQGLSQAMRPEEMVAEIMRTGQVTISRAMTIARTEVGRTTMEFRRSRAEAIGSVAYTWLTSRDSDVRPSHRKMEGKMVRWDDPPTLDGIRAHAGASPNCRCTALPIIPL